MSGWTDCALSTLGHDQVRRLSARLAGEPPFAVIYASPLRRALQTATALSAAGLGAVEIDAGLREIGCGELDGMPIDEVKRRYSELWRSNLRQDDDDFRWPGGESYAELRARAVGTIQEIAQRHIGQRVALVTHAGVISQLVGFLRGSRPARWEDCRPDNTSLTQLASVGGSLSLERFNDCLHLADERTRAARAD